MSNYIATDTDLIAVANAIRTKTGTTSSITFPNEFVNGITGIPSGRDWSEIGYSAEPDFIQTGVDYAKQIQPLYTNSTTYLNDKKLTFMPMVDTSARNNMSSMFNGCSALVFVPQLDTSNATSMYGMFQGCSVFFCV